MANDFVESINSAPLPTREHLFAKGLIMPFNCTNSGTRKLMFSTNLEQRLALNDPDVPYVSTGYENEYGKYSSSFNIADEPYTVIARIPKFSNLPRHHFYMILLNAKGDRLTLVERSEYKHSTETFGYICNNETIDIFHEGDTIPVGHILHQSKAFDEYGNRMDGKNLLALFTASEETMEDSIIISESASQKLSSPLVHKFNIIFNTNDIPLNLFGDGQRYKIFPDIGEYTKNDILCAIRREQKEEVFYSQDFNRLSQIFMSDEKITVYGKMVDIDIKCNNPEVFDEIYYDQIAYYYHEHLRVCREIVEAVDNYRGDGSTVKMDYPLEVLYSDCLAELNGTKFINEKVYAGTIVTVTVVEDIKASVCDKITNRYGGKGVISRVRPDHLMPKTYDGETIDILINICGVYGRENAGQLFEMSYNFRSRGLVKSLCDEFSTTEENIKNIEDFLNIVSPKQGKAVTEFFNKATDDEAMQFISSIIDDGMLYIDVDPGFTPSLETISQLDERFPWIQQEYLLMPLEDSNGNVRYVESRRPVVYGYIYYYRLKQHSEEKFSVTSLSATNIKNENSRNKASKVYKAQFSRTPIRFGYMEMGDMSHMGIEMVVQVLMLYSSSPEARMLCEKAMTGNPYKVDIQLENSSTNIQAEILNTYLKTLGLRLKFFKIPKKKLQPLLKNPFEFFEKPDEMIRDPFIHYHPDEKVDHEAVLKRAEELGKYKRPLITTPFKFTKPVDECIKQADDLIKADIEAEKKEKNK